MAALGLLGLLTISPARAAEPVQVDENGLVLTSADGEHQVDVHLLAHAWAEVAHTDGAWSSGAWIRRARILARYRDARRGFGLMLQPELAGATPSLLDARLDWAASDHVALAVGQMIVPYTRAWNTPLPLVVVGDRSALDSTLAPGRRVGGYAHLQASERLVETWIGLYDPGPADAGLAPMALVRVQVNPLGALPNDEMTLLDGAAPTRLGVGLAGLIEPVRDGDRDVARVSAAADASLQSGPVRADVEAFLRDGPSATALGVSALVAGTLVPERVVIGARGTVEDPGDAPGRLLGEAFVNLHALGPHVMGQLRGTLEAPDDGPTTHRVALHTQAWF